ncbi:coiled-coil domain-containing protein 12-like [Oppia nitens]|uniref:coiled-coil domain-containing protein 12-like n=1 Tax=Oppia nitens TaxID=1686743 RepID=UPI0023DB6947|nr:coiled-coil domain-containing protein 12-like [Oppia nitens]
MKSDDSSVGNLEEEARKRKERLEQMKRRLNNENNDSTSEDNKLVLPKPIFRSYNPTDEKLKENSLPKPKPESVEKQIEDQLTVANNPQVLDEVDLTSLAPRKVDWDLKRNLQQKLDKLEKRTQRAIAELIRERLRESSVVDLATATQDLEATQNNVDFDED